MAGFFNGACDKAMFGWPCDPTIEKFRDQFAANPTCQAEAIVEALQTYWAMNPTHVILGQCISRRHAHQSRRRRGGAVTIFWNMSKK